MFCDSDDIVGPMWIEHLVSYAKEGILPVCAYCTEYDQLGKTKNLEGVINEKEVDRSAYYYYHKAGIAGFLWNALYSRNVIIENHLFFRTQQDKGDYNEDLIFALSYVDKIEGLIYTGYADYLYNMRGTSLSHSYQRYYFDKYAEKYIFWKKFVEQENALEHELCLKELATELLYHVLISLQRETEQTDEFFSKEYYNHFYKILHSKAVRECVFLADTSRENQIVIWGIKYKCSRLLWTFFKLLKIKKKWREKK